MAMTREELEKKGLEAKSAEELAELLKAEGHEVTKEEAEELFKTVRIRQGEVEKLSMDELDAVAGGGDRDYATEGCAATVEPGSDCWGTDGGCSVCNIEYENMPIHIRCPRCNAWLIDRESYRLNYGFWDSRTGLYYLYKCRNCGEFEVKQ